MGFIYKVTNTVNGKIYIGQTSRTIEVRWREHVQDALGRDKKVSFAFHRAIKKYGENAFVVDQIEECDSAELDERERYWIKHYNAYKSGYNADFGGRSNRGHPIYQYALDGTFIRGFETLGDARAFVGCKNIMLSSKHPERAISGYLWSRDKVDKLDFEAHPKEKPVHQYSIDGRYITTFDSLTHAAQTIRGRNTGALIGAACRGAYDTVYGYRWSFDKVDILPAFAPFTLAKKVVRISIDGADKKVYESIKDAAADNNVSAPNIIEVCKGRNKTCKGYYWKYLDSHVS